jgi:hypothetical protein
VTGRWLEAAALAVFVLGTGRQAAAEGLGAGPGSAGANPGHGPAPWVDDEAVLAARRVRLGVGYGVAYFRLAVSSDQTYGYIGSGLNLEDALGIGHGLEVGVRFGARVTALARGLRADEVARGLDTETFGTGLDTWANPELRLRWRAIRWSWGEAGLEDRVVLPIRPSPNPTEVLGGWARLHFLHRIRLDAALNGVLEVQSLARGRVLAPALGAPVQLWANVTRGLFVGLLATVHHAARTPFAESTTRVEVGAGVGFRFPVCDGIASGVALDATAGFTERLGLGLGASCHL